ncbi:MAG: hypothetical protein FWG77_11445, partial [Treponema sp.]|nr:hypothetical protein [Treponema sp.]
MKRYLSFVLIAFLLVFSGCSDFSVGDDDLITVTIGLGSGGFSRQTGFDGDDLQMGDLVYEVVLTNVNTGQVVEATVNHGPTITTASAVIAAGKWKIDVVTTLTADGATRPGMGNEGTIYAVGTTGDVDIDASTGTIEVPMDGPKDS